MIGEPERDPPPDGHATDHVEPQRDAVARILDRRAAALARLRVEAQSGGTPAVIVKVAGERFALAAHAVQEVFAIRSLTPLPSAPRHVAGLVARGGRVLPAYHLHEVLRLRLVSLPEHGRAVLLGSGADAVVLLVEAVDVETAIDHDALAPLNVAVSRDLQLLAVGLTADGVVVLDTRKLLASPLLVIDIAPPRTS